jgi:hypothetical protein
MSSNCPFTTGRSHHGASRLGTAPIDRLIAHFPERFAPAIADLSTRCGASSTNELGRLLGRRSYSCRVQRGEPVVYLITDPMAAGKSTVARLLATRFKRGVHLEGDIFRRSIVSGREELTPTPSPEAAEQLRLRYRLRRGSRWIFRSRIHRRAGGRRRRGSARGVPDDDPQPPLPRRRSPALDGGRCRTRAREEESRLHVLDVGRALRGLCERDSTRRSLAGYRPNSRQTRASPPLRCR